MTDLKDLKSALFFAEMHFENLNNFLIPAILEAVKNLASDRRTRTAEELRVIIFIQGLLHKMATEVEVLSAKL